MKDILEVMQCRNCKNLVRENGKFYCKERNKTEQKLDDTCGFFSESIEYLATRDILANPDLFNLITEKELDRLESAIASSIPSI